MSDLPPSPVEPVTDTWNVRLVILFLGLAVLGCIAGGAVLAGMDKAIPDSVIAIGSGASGALAAMLASTRSLRT